jgi:putative membrane protein
MKMTEIKLGMMVGAILLTPLCVSAQLPTQTGGTQTAGSAQSNQSSTPQSVVAANSTAFGSDLNSGGAGTDPQLVRDKIFMRYASQGSFAEVQFGELAVAKGTSEGVKKLGQKMADDHTILNRNMQPVQDELGVRVPKKLDKNAQAQYDKLNALSGPEFDKEYIAFVIRDHHHDLDEFQREEGVTNDPSVREVAAKGEKVIYYHLRWANKLAAANGLPTAPAPGSSPQ